jgi:nicotinamidase-related amidase
MVQPHTINLRARYYRAFPPSQPLGSVEEELSLGLSDTVLLIVDVYGLGYDGDHKLADVPEPYRRDVEANREIVVHHLKPAKVAAKKVGLPVVYLNNYLAPSTTEHNEWRNMSIRSCGVDVLKTFKEPSEVLAFSEIIAPEEGDYLIKKQHYSGFFETHLESLLKELGARNLITMGFDSLICVHSTVLDALFRNYRVIVLRDCVRTNEYVETMKEGWANWLAIRYIEANVGYTATSQDFIQACAGVLAAKGS